MAAKLVTMSMCLAAVSATPLLGQLAAACGIKRENQASSHSRGSRLLWRKGTAQSGRLRTPTSRAGSFGASLAREGRRRTSPVGCRVGSGTPASMQGQLCCSNGAARVAPAEGCVDPTRCHPRKEKRKNLAVRPAHLNEVESRRIAQFRTPVRHARSHTSPKEEQPNARHPGKLFYQPADSG
jgi:hypothetical protein